MVAPVKTEELQATALGKCSAGISDGRNDWPAAPLNDRTTPLPNKTA